MNESGLVLLDCTLRDGGYHNNWDFDTDLIQSYLWSMSSISVDFVELGFRSLEKEGFKGGCAYTTDGFIGQFDIPPKVSIGVMINTGELIRHPDGFVDALIQLFVSAEESPVSLVRLATHFDEIDEALEICEWLKNKGYLVGINMMQIADRSEAEVEELARKAEEVLPDILYFADSLGSLSVEETSKLVEILRRNWSGALGIHAHDNMGRALANSLQAIDEGVSWVDSTVTGMGRGPGNAKTEHLAIEIADKRQTALEIAPLLKLIETYFQPLKLRYNWGTNTYYYLAGKYGIHPTYVQSMLSDVRYLDDDVLAVIEHLREAGGKKFRVDALETGRNFYQGEVSGSWMPAELLKGREVLLLGSGPGAQRHSRALESFIGAKEPLVIAINASSHLNEELIDLRLACHPFRLLSSAVAHLKLPQPLVTPASILPGPVMDSLEGKKLLDFGLMVSPGKFEFGDSHCVLPTALAVGYGLAVAASGLAERIFLAGFDGYGSGDPRNVEVEELLDIYQSLDHVPDLVTVTPSRYNVTSSSIYSLI